MKYYLCIISLYMICVEFFFYNTAAQRLIIVIDFYIIVSAFITGM